MVPPKENGLAKSKDIMYVNGVTTTLGTMSFSDVFSAYGASGAGNDARTKRGSGPDASHIEQANRWVGQWAEDEVHNVRLWRRHGEKNRHGKTPRLTEGHAHFAAATGD